MRFFGGAITSASSKSLFLSSCVERVGVQLAACATPASLDMWAQGRPEAKPEDWHTGNLASEPFHEQTLLASNHLAYEALCLVCHLSISLCIL